MMHKDARFGLISALLLAVAVPAFADGAKGTIRYDGQTKAIEFAYLVTGPYDKRLILSTVDLSKALLRTEYMQQTNAFDLFFEEEDTGITIDLDRGPPSEYEVWFSGRGAPVSINGKLPPGSLVVQTNNAKRLAGTLRFETSASGPKAKVDVAFDAKLLKEYSKP